MEIESRDRRGSDFKSSLYYPDGSSNIHNGNGAIIAFNNDWKDTDQAGIEATGIPPSNDKESAILATLAPGGYTAIVRGQNGTTGVALVEVYDLY